jgi:hypothetical protein
MGKITRSLHRVKRGLFAFGFFGCFVFLFRMERDGRMLHTEKVKKEEVEKDT